MELPIKQCGKYTILRAGQDLTLCSEARRMQNALDLLLDNNKRHICVDLSGAAIIESSVLGAIVACHISASKCGGEVVILSAQNLVLEILMRTQLHRVMRFIESEAELENA